MNILNWIIENWKLISGIIALIVAVFAGTNGAFNQLIAKAMLFAEKGFDRLAKTGELTGIEKKIFVVNFVYSKIPGAVRIVISREYIERKIENMIIDIHDLKDDGKLNASVPR